MYPQCFRVTTGKTDCIIVLGAQVKGIKITDSLKRRLDRAVRYLREFPETKVIVSGGKGPGEDITEADAMGDYLISCGIDPGRIVRENRSASTRENLRYSGKYTDPEHDSVGIVTNGFPYVPFVSDCCTGRIQKYIQDSCQLQSDISD